MLKAHVVGSLLRPGRLLELAARYRKGEIPIAEFKRMEDAAVDQAIEVQERAGIDLITDGEQRRLAFGDVFGQSVSGMEAVAPETVKEGGLWHGVKTDAPAVEVSAPTGGRIVAKLQRRESKASEEFAYARARAHRPVKVTLPSPTMLISAWSPEHSTKAYRNLEAALDDGVEILKQEVRALRQLGCEHIQFDAPEATFAIESETSFVLRWLGYQRENFCELIVRRLNEVTVEPGMEFSVHFCRGNARGHWHSAGGYGAISKLIFPHLTRFKYVLMEYDSERAGGFEPLRDLPKECVAVLGLVTTKNGVLEQRDSLRARIDEAARFFPREQLALSPQCGFASDAGGNPITFEQQSAKLRLVAEVAHDVLR
jgi:5-methyltetrahydropteroyltriglutamate--homocysteine methyltransferase